jgi:hypothetical protein
VLKPSELLVLTKDLQAEFARFEKNTVEVAIMMEKLQRIQALWVPKLGLVCLYIAFLMCLLAPKHVQEKWGTAAQQVRL